MNLPASPSQTLRRRNPHLFGSVTPEGAGIAPSSPVGEPEAPTAAQWSGPERALHDRIEEDLKVRRFYYVHSRMDKTTTTALGVPDFIVALPDGATLWLEVKRKGGKLTAQQTVTRHLLLAAGHRYALAYSFEDYLSAVQTLHKD